MNKDVASTKDGEIIAFNVNCCILVYPDPKQIGIHLKHLCQMTLTIELLNVLVNGCVLNESEAF